MRTNGVSTALRDRLGQEGTLGLLEFVDSEHTAWSDRVLSLAADRFERRLAEELAQLRVAMVREIHDAKGDAFKWTFLFWIGQVAVIAGLLAYMLRTTGR